MIDEVRCWTSGRFLCEMVAFVAGLTFAALTVAPEQSTVRFEAAPIQSPFSTYDLPENDPPTTYRMADNSTVYTTTGSDGPTLTTYTHWPTTA